MKHDIFTNPKGWAQKTVGSSARYRFMQLMTVLFALCLSWIFLMVCRQAALPLFGYFSVLVFLLNAVVLLPLCYLRALRCYVTESRAEKEI